MKFLFSLVASLAACTVAMAQNAEEPALDPVFDGVQIDEAVTLGNTGQSRVVNGIEAPPDKYPFMTFLSREVRPGRFAACGGARIAPNWVLTAAHCVVEKSENGRDDAADAARVAIRQGSNVRNSGPKINVAEVIPHPGYNKPYRIYNDIALLRLAEPVEGAQVLLPKRGTSPRAATAVNVVGWGKTASGDKAPTAKTLREGRTKLVTRRACAEVHEYVEGLIKKKNKKFTSPGPIDQTRVCAEVQNVKKPVDTCQGDSGGPLVAPTSQGFVAVGIVSYSYGCAVPGLHAVYTNVAHYMPWIEKTTGLRFGASGPKPIRPKPATPKPATPKPQPAQPNPAPAKPQPVKPAPSTANAGTKPAPVTPAPTAPAAVTKPAAGDPEMEITSIEGEGSVNIIVRGGTNVAPSASLVFEVVSSLPGRLQILDIGSDGTVNNIFPNTRTVRGRVPGDVRAETPFVTPTRQHGFRFRAPDKPTERLLVAIVMKDRDLRHAESSRAGPVATPDKFLKETVQRLRAACESGGASCAIGATRLVVR